MLKFRDFVLRLMLKRPGVRVEMEKAGWKDWPPATDEDVARARL